jgi:hypothetical protein
MSTQRAAETFPLPHRIARTVFYGICFVFLGFAIIVFGDSDSGTTYVVLAIWSCFTAGLLVRTSRARIVLSDREVVASGVFRTRRIARQDLERLELETPQAVSSTGLSSGERLIAVLKNEKRITLAYDQLRSTGRQCTHYSDLVIELNDRLHGSSVRSARF